MSTDNSCVSLNDCQRINMWHMISIGYKDCRGCKGGIHHSIQTKNFNPNGLNPCRSGHQCWDENGERI